MVHEVRHLENPVEIVRQGVHISQSVRKFRQVFKLCGLALIEKAAQPVFMP